MLREISERPKRWDVTDAGEAKSAFCKREVLFSFVSKSTVETLDSELY